VPTPFTYPPQIVKRTIYHKTSIHLHLTHPVQQLRLNRTPYHPQPTTMDNSTIPQPKTTMYPTIHSIQSAQAPLYTSPASPPIAPPSFAFRMHRLSGSTIAGTPRPVHAQPTSFARDQRASLNPDIPSLFPQNLPLRPTPASTWTRINIAHYILPRPTVAVRPADVEMGSMSQRRYGSGASGQQERSGKWSKRTMTKLGVVLAIVAVFWVFIIVGVVLRGRRVTGTPGV
jgi:hypothetical protein